MPAMIIVRQRKTTYLLPYESEKWEHTNMIWMVVMSREIQSKIVSADISLLSSLRFWILAFSGLVSMICLPVGWLLMFQGATLYDGWDLTPHLQWCGFVLLSYYTCVSSLSLSVAPLNFQNSTHQLRTIILWAKAKSTVILYSFCAYPKPAFRRTKNLSNASLPVNKKQ